MITWRGNNGGDAVVAQSGRVLYSGKEQGKEGGAAARHAKEQ